MSLKQFRQRSTVLLGLLWASVFIALAVVATRLYAFGHPSQTGPPPLVALGQAFEGHRGLTLAHILPAFLFGAMAPIAPLLSSSTWAKPILLFLGTVVAGTAYAKNVFAVGDRIEQAGVFLFL